jgi:hypothetical protein
MLRLFSVLDVACPIDNPYLGDNDQTIVFYHHFLLSGLSTPQ